MYNSSASAEEETFFKFIYLSMLRYYCNYEFKIMNYELQMLSKAT